MSTISHVTTQPLNQAGLPSSTQPLVALSLTETATKASKYFCATVLGIIATGSLAIGITMTPFAPEIGIAAIAFSTTLFAMAGFLVHSAKKPVQQPTQPNT